MAQLLPKSQERHLTGHPTVRACVQEDSHFPTTRLVCLENTANKGGGACYSLESMKVGKLVMVWGLNVIRL